MGGFLADHDVAVGQNADEAARGPRILQLAERVRDGPANVGARILEQRQERLDGTLVLYVAKRSRGGLPHAGLGRAKRVDQRRHRTRILQRSQRPRAHA
jgi:hypothetical protein